MEKALPASITMTRTCLADGQHRKQGEVLTVGKDVSKEHARTLLDMGSAAEGGEKKTRTPRAPKAAGAGTGTAGGNDGAGSDGDDDGDKSGAGSDNS